MDGIGYKYIEETTSKDQFVGDILKMLERGSLNDVKIKLSDGEIVANKDILMARCEYFATMFSNKRFIEGETSSVDMSHCNKAFMDKIVKYLFSGGFDFDGLTLTQLMDLSYVSEMMLLKCFTRAVEDFIIDQLQDSAYDVQSLPEFISGLKLADQYPHLDVKKFMLQDIYLGIRKIPKDTKCSDSFKTLSFDLIKEIFYNKPPMHNNDGFEPFIVWLSANEITEEEKADIIENNFDLEDFTVEELLTVVKDSGFYPANEIDKRVVDLYKELEDRFYDN